MGAIISPHVLAQLTTGKAIEVQLRESDERGAQTLRVVHERIGRDAGQGLARS